MGRPGPHRHSKGDPPDPEDSGGRPVTDNTDTVGDFLLFHAGSGEAKPLEWYIMMVHNDRSVNFKYPFKFVSPSPFKLHFSLFSQNRVISFLPLSLALLKKQFQGNPCHCLLGNYLLFLSQAEQASLTVCWWQNSGGSVRQ